MQDLALWVKADHPKTIQELYNDLKAIRTAVNKDTPGIAQHHNEPESCSTCKVLLLQRCNDGGLVEEGDNEKDSCQLV